MNQYKTVPEFILEESVKTPLMAKQLGCIIRDFSAVEVDLQELCLQASKLESMLLSNIDSIQELVQSLQEQV